MLCGATSLSVSHPRPQLPTSCGPCEAEGLCLRGQRHGRGSQEDAQGRCKDRTVGRARQHPLLQLSGVHACARQCNSGAATAGRMCTMQTSQAELKQLTAAFGERDDAIRQGLVAGGTRYEVRRAACMHVPCIHVWATPDRMHRSMRACSGAPSPPACGVWPHDGGRARDERGGSHLPGRSRASGGARVRLHNVSVSLARV